MNGGTLLVLYIQDDRYFGSLYGLETHDKRKKARAKADVFPSKSLLHLWGEHNLLKISSIKAFFHIPLLHSKHPVNNILQELINHQPHKKKKSPFCFLRIGQNWFLMIGQLSWVRLTEVIWSRHNLAVWRMKLFW